MPNVSSPVLVKSEEPIEEISLDLSALDLDSISRLEGTALGGVIREMKDAPADQPNAVHRSHDKFRAHGTIRWN